MTYYIFVEDLKLNGCGQHKMIGDNIKNIEVSEEVYNKYIETPNFYMLQKGDVVENPYYEKEEEEKNRLAKIEEYKEQLNEIDFKTIRAIRANDTEYIQKYESEAIEIRNKIRELENNEDNTIN